MPAFQAPWAALGLLALPVLVWLHRRLRRPVPVDVPTLRLLAAEDAAPRAPERRRFDVELWLALAAVTAWSLGAAGPVVTAAEGGRTIRVAFDVSPAMAARPRGGRSAAERAHAVLEALRAARRSGDVLVEVPVAGGRDALLAAALSGPASLRVVVTDRRLAPPAPAGVREVAVGDPRVRNAGIVAVDVVDDGEGSRAFVNVWNDDPEARRVVVRAGGEERALDVPAASARAVEFPLADAESVDVRVVGEDDFGGDDVVVVRRGAVRVGFAGPTGGVPTPVAAAVRAGLAAAAPGGAVAEDAERPDVWFGPVATAPASARAIVEFSTTAAGASSLRPRARDVVATDARDVGLDLDPRGCDLVFPPDAPLPLRLVREREPRGAARVFAFGPDPIVGTPPPVEHAIWPLFLDDVLSAAIGRAGPRGRRVRGLLSPDATRLGRDAVPFSPAWLDDAASDRPPRRRHLRAGLLLLGSLAGVGLWIASRRRTTPSVA